MAFMYAGFGTITGTVPFKNAIQSFELNVARVLYSSFHINLSRTT